MAKKPSVLITDSVYKMSRSWETSVPSQLMLVRLTLSLLWMTTMFSHRTCWGPMTEAHESPSTRPLDTSIGMAWTHLHGIPMSIARFKSKPVSIVLLTFCKQPAVSPFMACNILIRERKGFFHLFFLVRRHRVLDSETFSSHWQDWHNEGVLISIRFNFTALTDVFLNSDVTVLCHKCWEILHFSSAVI